MEGFRIAADGARCAKIGARNEPNAVRTLLGSKRELEFESKSDPGAKQSRKTRKQSQAENRRLGGKSDSGRDQKPRRKFGLETVKSYSRVTRGPSAGIQNFTLKKFAVEKIWEF